MSRYLKNAKAAIVGVLIVVVTAAAGLIMTLSPAQAQVTAVKPSPTASPTHHDHHGMAVPSPTKSPTHHDHHGMAMTSPTAWPSSS